MNETPTPQRQLKLVEKISAKENPDKAGWYDTDKGRLYFFKHETCWSSREDRVSDEYPQYWYKPYTFPVKQEETTNINQFVKCSLIDEFKRENPLENKLIIDANNYIKWLENKVITKQEETKSLLSDEEINIKIYELAVGFYEKDALIQDFQNIAEAAINWTLNKLALATRQVKELSNIDFDKIEKRLDQSLEIETKESLNQWLVDNRMRSPLTSLPVSQNKELINVLSEIKKEFDFISDEKILGSTALKIVERCFEIVSPSFSKSLS